MNLKRSPFSILDKDKREMDYIKSVYKKKIQSEIESYKDIEDEDKIDTIQVQNILMLDKIAIWYYFLISTSKILLLIG